MGRPSIYGLIHPETGELRYIGKANRPARRLATHIRDSRRRNTPVYCWIRKLADSGLQPDMVVLAETDNWEQAERSLIHRARVLGHNLLNVADGGNQPECPKHVQAANGRKTAQKRNDVIWRLMRRLGLAIVFARKRGNAHLEAKLLHTQATMQSLTPQERERFAARWVAAGHSVEI